MAKMRIDTSTNTIKSGGGAGLTLDPSSGEVVTISEGALLPDGSVSQPALRFSDDTNTGLYSPSNDVVALAAHGADMARFVGVSSAVNYLEVTPSTTGNDVGLSVEGSDTNIDLAITAKGTGTIALGNFVLDADQTVGAGQDDYVLTYDNASGLISLEAAGGGGGSSYLDVNSAGTAASATGTDAIAVGPSTTSSGESSVVIGDQSNASANGAIAITWNGEATATGAVSIGGGFANNEGASATDNYAIAIGASTSSDDQETIAIGRTAEVLNNSSRSVAIGSNSQINFSNTESVALGHGTKITGTSGDDCVVIGADATANQNGNISIGADSDAVTGNGAIALGKYAQATNIYATALGYGTTASGTRSIAVGHTLTNSTTYSAKFGQSDSNETWIHTRDKGKLALGGAEAAYVLPSYTVATVPTGETGATIYVTDGDAGSPCVAVYDGSDWKRISLGSTISAT